MSRSVVMFCTRGTGHFSRMRPIIRGLAKRGVTVHVYTLREFAAAVTADGGQFVDVFAKYSSDAVDATSIPFPCRGVTFAGAYADEVAKDVALLGPSFIVYDTFSVVGFVVAKLLGIPHVNVCAGHNVAPKRFLAALEKDPRVAVAEECYRAAETLRTRHGIEHASPFLYVATQSRFLNIYCEPPEFLPEAERGPFEPIEFFGSLPSPEDLPPQADVSYFPAASSSLDVYVSFGTVIWPSFEAEALASMHTIVDALSAMDGVRTVVSTGNASLPEGAAAALGRQSVSVHDYVDQRRILQEADLFVTHHGLNSTHEAIWNGVPMISRPFFWDQPTLAARCGELGIAVPLGGRPRGPLTVEQVQSAVKLFVDRRESMRGHLERAKQWELDVMGRRGAVLDRMLALA